MDRKIKGGFTMIEIVVAVSVILVLTAVVISNFVSIKKNSDLNSNVQLFASVLKLAQNKTLSSDGNSQYGVYINTGVSPNQYVLYKGSSYATRIVSADQVNYLDSSMEFYAINLGGGQEIVFDRLTGTSEESGSISVRLKSDTSQNKTVYIAGSGTVSYSPPSGNSLDDSRIKDSRHVQFTYGRNINTANEIITLTFNGNQTQTIPISSYLAGGEIYWQGTVAIGGSDQTIEISTVRLNDPDTLFNIFRDMRYNSKSLNVTISGDNSGYLAQYSADGSTVNYSSINVSNFTQE